MRFGRGNKNGFGQLINLNKLILNSQSELGTVLVVGGTIDVLRSRSAGPPRRGSPASSFALMLMLILTSFLRNSNVAKQFSGI